jgi:hypothetical protein
MEKDILNKMGKSKKNIFGLPIIKYFDNIFYVDQKLLVIKLKV